MSSDRNQAPPPRVGRDMTVGSIPRHLVAFALPMLAGSALQTAYSFVNAFWVGKKLGTQALAAVTVSQPVIFVSIAAAAGLTLATNILIAQYYGARDWDRLKGVVQTSVVFITVVGFVLLALGLTFDRRLLSLINTPPDVFAASLSYLRIVLWTLPLAFWIFLIISMLRGIGDSKTPVYFQVVSVVVNVVLDPLLMFGWLGFPKLGLNGTAWATIFSQAAAVIALMIYVPKHRPLVMPEWRRRLMDLQTTWLLVEIGFPSMVQQSVVSVSMFVIVSLVSKFGSLTDAAFGAALRIDSIAFLPAMTMGIAVATLAGQNIGARKLERVREVFWWGVLLSGSISLVIAASAISFPGFFLRLFVNDPRVVVVGTGYLHIVAITYVIYAVMFVSHGIINGAGHTLVTTMISMIALWGIRLPLAALLSNHSHRPTGIWYAMLVSVACGMVLSVGVYFSGFWKRPVVKLRFFPGNRRVEESKSRGVEEEGRG